MCSVNIGPTGIGPSSLDLLSLEGVLPYDATMYVTGKPSPYLQNLKAANGGFYSPQLSVPMAKDVYIPPNKKGIVETWLAIKAKYKDIAFGALALYLLGVVASKGKKNPIEGVKGLFKVANKILNGFCWFVGKMTK